MDGVSDRAQDMYGWHPHEVSLPVELLKGEYVMTLRHSSQRTEARVDTVDEFRAIFTIGDEISEEEVHSWAVGKA